MAESAAQEIRGSIGVLEDRLREQAEFNKVLRSCLDGRSGCATGAAVSETGGVAVCSAPTGSVPLWSEVAARPVAVGEPASSPVARPELISSPRRLDVTRSSPGVRPLPPAVVVRSAEPGVLAMDAIRPVRSMFSPSELGIKRIRTRETVNGNIIMEVLDVDGGGKADLLAKKIRASLGGGGFASELVCGL